MARAEAACTAVRLMGCGAMPRPRPSSSTSAVHLYSRHAAATWKPRASTRKTLGSVDRDSSCRPTAFSRKLSGSYTPMNDPTSMAWMFFHASPCTISFSTKLPSSSQPFNSSHGPINRGLYAAVHAAAMATYAHIIVLPRSCCALSGMA